MSETPVPFEGAPPPDPAGGVEEQVTAAAAPENPEAEHPTERLKRLKAELEKADKFNEQWSKEFRVARLEDFVVKSKQRRSSAMDSTSFEADTYIVNELSPSLNSRLPALMFDTPRAVVTPRDPLNDDPKVPAVDPALEAAGLVPPGGQEIPQSIISAQRKAKLGEDILNTILQDKRSGFTRETNLALREAFFRFGVVEAYYTADFKNLDAELELQVTENITVKPAELGLERVPEKGSERIRFRRRRAEDFRVSANSKNDLHDCDWSGYYEWVFLDDLKKNPNYMNLERVPDNLISSSTRVDTEGGTKPEGSKDSKPPADGMVRIFKMWHHREMKRYVWIERDNMFIMDAKPFQTLPYAALTFEDILDQFYPVPPCFNWTGVQIEYNETRDMDRVHRKRALRKYLYQEGALTDAQLANLTSNEDMAFAMVSQAVTLDRAVRPLEMAPQDPIHDSQYVKVRAELQEVTKVGGEQKGFAESKTASQANIIAVNKQVQDSTDRNRVADWLSRLCYIALRLAREHFTFPAVVKTSVDLAGPQAAQEASKVKALWQAVKMEDIGDLDYEVSIDLESMSPPNSTMQAQQWQQLLALLSQPTVLPWIAGSEVIARKTLSIYGIRDEEQVQEVMRVAKTMAVGMAGAQGAPVPGAAPAPGPGGQPDQGAMIQQALASLEAGGVPA